MEYTAKINHNAYKPETRVISDKPSVKVGQWWQWNDDPVFQGYNIDNTLHIDELRGAWAVYKGCDTGEIQRAPISLLQELARLILDPDWPVEVGDRFETTRMISRGSGPMKTETVVWKVIDTNGETAHCRNETGEYNEEDVISVEDLRSMRRLPRVEEKEPTWYDEHYAAKARAASAHIADASEKVSEDDQQYQKTIKELFDKHPQHFIDNHVANGAGGYYDAEPAMRWINEHYEDYIAKDKRVAQLETYMKAHVRLTERALARMDDLYKILPKAFIDQHMEAGDYLFKGPMQWIAENWTSHEDRANRILSLGKENADLKKERDAALARVKELEEEDPMPQIWYIRNLLIADGFDLKKHNGEAECVKFLIDDKDRAIQRAIDAEKRIAELETELEMVRNLRAVAFSNAPSSSLPRYGLQWNGPKEFVSTLMDDGYWTPWHVSDSTIAALRRELEEVGKRASEAEAITRELIESIDGNGNIADSEQQLLRIKKLAFGISGLVTYVDTELPATGGTE